MLITPYVDGARLMASVLPGRKCKSYVIFCFHFRIDFIEVSFTLKTVHSRRFQDTFLSAYKDFGFIPDSN